jgi:putative pyruvate formate lyase activating enzyme
VAKALPHFGEEPPLSGNRGAGTVFFSGCALNCLYCQNYQISQEGLGEEMEVESLAHTFLHLQDQGCHNLDLVSPTPHLPFILKALEIAVPQGLRLPLVYNTHGYLSAAVLDLLRGIVDIYLPDMKYGDNTKAYRWSQVEDYTSYNRTAVQEMFRQVGPLALEDKGIAYRGLLVRHLVLPQNQAGTTNVIQELASISPEIPLSLMAQYRPGYKAKGYAEINRSLLPGEYTDVLALAEKLAFEEIYLQEMDSAEIYYPDFTQEDPFESGKRE